MRERKMAMVTKQSNLKDDQETEDLLYWLSRPPQERLRAVTLLIRQNMSIGQRMDRTAVAKRSIK